MKHFIDVEILSHELIEKDVYSLTLNAPQIATEAKPGQFVMVYLDRNDLLLPRPISLCDADIATGTITLVYMVVGDGTNVMSKWQAGYTIKIMGPLGNGFSIDGLQNATLVGGGIGAPPLVFLHKSLTRKGIPTDVYLGFKQKSNIKTMFVVAASNLCIATDDGSDGQKGTVIDLLKNAPNPNNTILACGPTPMLKALSQYTKSTDTPCQLALEERMACGIGACVGCAIKTATGYQLCCKSGPIFDSKEVVW